MDPDVSAQIHEGYNMILPPPRPKNNFRGRQGLSEQYYFIMDESIVKKHPDFFEKNRDLQMNGGFCSMKSSFFSS